MTPTNSSIELISSDPVIIDSSETQEVNDSTKPTANEKPAKNEDDLVESVANLEVDPPRRPFERPVRVIRHGRNYSPSPPPHRFGPAVYEVPSLVNTATLNDLINEPDTCANTIDGRLVYIANTPFHAADLEKVSWILKIGIQDSWVQKPVGYLTANGFQSNLPPGNSRRRIEYVEQYDDGYNMPRGRGAPIVRLGNALRIFKSDEKKYRTEKVKFVIAVQGKGNEEFFKLVVCHSRQAAAVDIFHEVLNHHSIAFVGAVLKDVVVGVEAPNKLPAVKFQRVGSVKEAEEVGEGVVGVIC
jgi:hypothetical protein